MIVDQFLQWSCQAPAEQRALATHALARVFLFSDISEDDRDAAEAAMTFLLDDPALEVRQALCDVLAGEAGCPRHIALGLLDDEDQLAEQIVRLSPVLIDSELVDIAATRGKDFQLAVAKRASINPSVSAALAEIADADVCVELLLNPHAHVLPSTLFRLSQRFGYNRQVQKLLLKRRDLPVSGRQLLIANLSEMISQAAVRTARLQPQRSEQVLRDARDRATLTLVRAIPENSLRELAEHLLATDQLTTVLLLRAICAGQVRFFVEALALLSGMPSARILSLLSDQRSGKALNALFVRAELPERAHPAFAIAFDVYFQEGAVVNPQDQYRFTRIMIERILDRYKNDVSADVDDLLAMLRRFASETARDSARAYVQAQLEAA